MKSNSAYHWFRILISNPLTNEVNPNCHHEYGPDTIDKLPFFQPAQIGQFGDQKQGRHGAQAETHHHTHTFNNGLERFGSLHAGTGGSQQGGVNRAAGKQAQQQTDWKISGENGAAKLLGIKRTTLEARMKKLNIHR